MRQAQGGSSSGGSGGARFGLPNGADVVSGLCGLGRWRDERAGLPKVGSAPNLDLESAGKKDLLEGRGRARCGERAANRPKHLHQAAAYLAMASCHM